MANRSRRADNLFFLSIFLISAAIGIAGGLLLPGNVLLGLTAVFIITWLVVVVLHSPHDPSDLVYVFFIGIPVMASIAWITYLLAMGFRA